MPKNMGRDFTLTDKDGVAYKATDYGDYYSVFVSGAWCHIPKDWASDPVGYLRGHLSWKKEADHA